MNSRPRMLLVGGLDPSVGAGVLLDAFVAARLGFQPVVVTTVVTAQDSAEWYGSQVVGEEAVRGQLRAAAADGSLAGVKIGALGSTANARVIAEALRAWHPPAVVVDPVIESSSGGALADRAAVDELFPLADVVTPNAAEALLLAGTGPDVGAAAALLAERRRGDVLVTGLPADAGHAADLLVAPDGTSTTLVHECLEGIGDPRGTGCMFSTALACRLAGAVEGGEARSRPKDAVQLAQQDLVALLRSVARIGRGRLQVDLAAALLTAPPQVLDQCHQQATSSAEASR